MRVVLSIVLLVALASTASAGSREAPEVPDPEGDCAFAPGNEYADIVAAWISDETTTDLLVNIELAKWTQDTLGSYAGYTLQFTHQDVQWGVAALYDPQNGWQWSTAQIDAEGSELNNFSDTTGEWDAASATMSIVFPKSIFPHSGNDNKLRAFAGGSADLKKDIPIFIAQGLGAPVPSQEFVVCDLAQSSAEYEFTVGQHTTSTATTTPDAPGDEAPTPAAPDATPTAASAPTREAPAIGLVQLIALLACLAAWRRA